MKTTDLLGRIFKNEVEDPHFSDKIIGSLSVSHPEILLEEIERVEASNRRKTNDPSTK
jgi:hypothetical protein